MGYSIRLKMYRRDVRQDGTCGIYLQVIINRRKKDIGLDLAWPPDKFIDEVGCKPRFKDDKQADDYNLIIGQERTKANDVILEYRMKRRPIDIDIFVKEFKSNLSKDDFIAYMTTKSKIRLGKKLISDGTYKQEQSTINKLKAFSEVIPFISFHAAWGYEFDQFLRKRYNNKQNTLWSEKKRVKTYLTLAADDGIDFIDPYKKVVIPQVESRFRALSKSQYKSLWDFYNSNRISPSEKTVLRRFLFSCCTGLRIGDLRGLTKDNFKEGKMSLDPEKTERYGTQINEVPLNDMALILLDDEIRESGYRLFYQYTEQYGNRMLKTIADRIGLNHDIHNHIGRSTFASLYDQAGGNHRSLMKYMGIKKIDTLMKYVQTNKEVIASDINKMNQSLAQEQTEPSIKEHSPESETNTVGVIDQ